MHLVPGEQGERILEICEELREDDGFRLRFLTVPPFEFEPDFELDYRGTIRVFADDASAEQDFILRVKGPNMVYTTFHMVVNEGLRP